MKITQTDSGYVRCSDKIDWWLRKGKWKRNMLSEWIYQTFGLIRWTFIWETLIKKDESIHRGHLATGSVCTLLFYLPGSVPNLLYELFLFYPLIFPFTWFIVLLHEPFFNSLWFLFTRANSCLSSNYLLTMLMPRDEAKVKFISLWYLIDFLKFYQA